MELLRISSGLYRPCVRRLSKSDLQSKRCVTSARSQNESIIKLSRISSCPYKSRVSRINKRDLPTVRRRKILKLEGAPVRRFSKMPPVHYRCRITPISLGDLQSMHRSTNIGSKAVQSNKNWLYSRNGFPLPIINDYSNIFYQQSQKTKKRKKKRPIVPPWVWLCCLLCAAFLLAAIVGILLAMLLPKPSITTTTTTTSTSATTSTSTSTTTSSSTTSSTSVTSTTTSRTTSTTVTTSSTTTVTTTTVTTCVAGSSFGSGILANETGISPSGWTQYNYSCVALTTSPILTFSFATNLYNNYFLDTVSVTAVSAPSIELLQNPSSENSTTILNGSVVWCNWTCSAGGGAQAMWGTNCYSSTGNCFLADCPVGSSGAIVFLGQSFPAIVGVTYGLSFRLRMAHGSGGSSLTQFTAAIN